MPPTMRPTQQPTPKPVEYWIVETTGMCVSDRDQAVPHWISQVFHDYNRCCMSSRDTAKCLRNAPIVPGQPIPPGPPPKTWYVDPAKGVCLSDEEKIKPAWIEETYMHYDQCCMNARNVELCKKARPENLGSGSMHPTPTPPVFYFADSTSGLCVSSANGEMVSAINILFPDRCTP